MQINAARLLTTINSLSLIGRDENGGITRCAFSTDLDKAVLFLKEQADSGFDFHTDGSGNVWCTLKGKDTSKTLLIGSHLDSVPNGGRLDGAYGIMAGLEVLRTISESGIKLPYNISLVSCCDEEGAYVSCIGSKAMNGKLLLQDFDIPRTGPSESLRVLMAKSGISPESAASKSNKLDPAKILGWIEVHIEQGPRLEDENIDIGVVSSIVGICSMIICFKGEANHAGTTPMDRRKDALLGASAFIKEWHECVREEFPDALTNVGNVDCGPSAVFNIIPGSCEVHLETRSDPETQARMKSRVDVVSQRIASEYGLNVTVDEIAGDHPPSSALDSDIQEAITMACDELGLSHRVLVSHAGHDTQMIASVVPAAMFFIPSIGGKSHCPQENSKESYYLVNGCSVLLNSVLALLKQ